MRSLLLILFSVGAVFAAPHDYLPPKHDGGLHEERIRKCIRELMWKEETQEGMIDKIYKNLAMKEKVHILSFLVALEKCDYKENFAAHLINSEAGPLDEALSKCSLDQKYLILKALFTHINAWNSKEVSLIVAQHIIDSVPKTEGTAPELMLSHMETFLQNVYPTIPSKKMTFESWYEYSIEQANNTSLSEPLRKKFGRLTVNLYELMKDPESKSS